MVAPRKAAFAEESAEVEVLYANLEKLKGLTKKIQGSLNRLETSGKSVEEAISPIFGNTQRLQVTNSNIDKIIDVIERIREPLDQRDQEERIIRSNPRTVGIPEYISSLDRATRALAGLKSSKLKSNQAAINELSQLLKYGAKQLEDVFREVLRKDTGTIEPLHYLTKGKPFPQIPEENASLLRLINTHVAASVAQTSQTSPQDYPTAKTYSEIRGDYIASSLRNLASASVIPARKQSPDEIYKPGSNGIGIYSDALRQMAVTEYDSICPIFAREEWGRMCTSTMQNALNEYGKTLRDLNAHIQTNLMADCYLAYEIIGIVTRLAMSLEKQTADLKQPVYDALKPIRETAKISLPRMLEDTRGRVQGIAGLPPDAGATPVTAEMMTRLQTLTSFLEPLSSVMTSLGDGMWSKQPTSPTGSYAPSTRSFDVGADGDKLFASYAGDTIETLLTALENRARLLLKSSSVQGVFMVNNIAIIDRMIRSSELQPLLAGAAPKSLDRWRTRCSKQYVNSWSDLASTLLDVQHTSRMRSSSGGGAIDSASVVKALSSKEKDNIKDKFKNFNTSFDDLVAKHKSYRMEKEARSAFAREIAQLIEPLYGRFWERYHEIDKGKGKYIKYNKSQMSSIMASLG